MELVAKQEWSDILGYGRVIKVLVGSKEEAGKMVPVFEELHLTPVSLDRYDESQSLVSEFFDHVGDNEKIGDEKQIITWSKDARETAAKIISLTLFKFHPDKANKEWVMKNLGLGTLAAAINVALDINDFLKGTGELMQKVAVMKGYAPTMRPMAS